MWLWKNRRDVGLVILSCVAIVSLASAILLAFRDRTVAAGVCAAMGLLLLTFLQLSRFKKVRGLGFEAELWEDKKREAEAIIEQMRGLLSLLASTVLDTASRVGRWDSHYSGSDLSNLAEDVENRLVAAGIAKEEILRVRNNVDRTIARDIILEIRQKVHARTHKLFNPIEQLTNPNNEEQLKKARNAQESEIILSHLSIIEEPLEQWATIVRQRIASIPLFSPEEVVAATSEVKPLLQSLDSWAEARQSPSPQAKFTKRSRKKT